MPDHEDISEIRRLLTRVESQLRNRSEDADSTRNFDALELPTLVAQVVDYLQPMLTTYESAIYWRLFRQSILAHGIQHARASVRGLQSGTVKSSSGQSDDLSYSSVKNALDGLEAKGAIAKAGDTNRDGTPYRVSLPEEIPICLALMTQDLDEQTTPVDEEADLDYYNVAENRRSIFERDEYRCHYCDKQLTRFSATIDHIQPVSEGGDNAKGNLVTACLHCNSSRGSKPVSDFLDDNPR